MNRLRPSAPASTAIAASVTGAALMLTGCGTTTSDEDGTVTVAVGSAPSQHSSTSSPAATTTATATATATPPEAAETARTTIPTELRLPSEGEDGWTATSTWPPYTPCEGVEVTLDAASDSLTIEHEVPESYSTETLAVFPDEQAASAFMAELQEVDQSCGTFVGYGDQTTTVGVRPLEGKWAQGLVAYSFTLAPHAVSGDLGPVPHGEYLLAARTRNAVAISGGSAEWVNFDHPEPKPEAVAAYRESLDELAPVLCSLAGADC